MVALLGASRVGRILAALAASLVLLGLPALPPAQATLDSVPALGATNLITSSVTAVSTVRIDAEATLSAEGSSVTAILGIRDAEAEFHISNPDIDIEGQGRVTGFALVETGAREPGERALLLATDLRMCADPGCTTDEGPYFNMVRFLERRDDQVVIPPGTYLLYVITDGTPVSIELRLGGLNGSTELDLSAHATDDVTVSVSPDSLSEPLTRTMHSRGESYELRGDEGLFLTALRLRGDHWVRGQYGRCLYALDLVPRPVAYSFPCVGGDGLYISDTLVRTVPYQNLFHSGTYVLREGGGTWGLGGGYAAAAHVGEFDYVQLGIDLPPEWTASETSTTQACVVALEPVDTLDAGPRCWPDD